ncbi:MAG: uracil-DNA glycosylase [Thiobacillaceae bacterium]
MPDNRQLTREAVFRELELWPVWREKSARPLADVQTDVTVQERPAPEIAPTIVAKNKPAPIAITGWDALREAVNTCTACKLHTTRTQGVPGVGDLNADWLIVGEAPGADEDAQGEPFVGQAGRLLDAMLAAIGLQRDKNVYITNVLKSRPPGNRNPEADEVEACMPYLLKQIELLQPKIILALGRFAAHSLLDTQASIAQLRGRTHPYQGVPLIVTYHPAYLLRSPGDKALAWEDLCLARETYSSIQANQVISL